MKNLERKIQRNKENLEKMKKKRDNLEREIKSLEVKIQNQLRHLK